MIVVLLAGVLVLVVGGCVCVFWAARGGAPRWVRGVSRVTLAASSVTRTASKRGNRSSGQNTGDDSDG
ncbi:hypothetical protein ACH4TX_02925 [Streptomyces sp. NPDC021098]|uniref:hypothetical protein n=1 Tax=unclassified Streptomyces TaxID=2593676 RepID=UPI0037A68855